MPITVNCHCGHQFRVRDEYAGKKAQCPTCGDPVVIPMASGGSASDTFDIQTDDDLPEAQPASFSGPRSGRPGSRRGGGGDWFGGLNTGLFGMGRLTGLACLLIGMVFVLLSRGCDSLANRSALAASVQYQKEQAEFSDEWEDQRLELQEELDDQQKKLNDADGPSDTRDIREKIAKIEEDISDSRQDESKARRKKERGSWQDLKRKSRDARSNNILGQYWRELLFVIGTVILSVGLLTVGFAGEITNVASV